MNENVSDVRNMMLLMNKLMKFQSPAITIKLRFFREFFVKFLYLPPNVLQASYCFFNFLKIIETVLIIDMKSRFFTYFLICPASNTLKFSRPGGAYLEVQGLKVKSHAVDVAKSGGLGGGLRPQPWVPSFSARI